MILGMFLTLHVLSMWNVIYCQMKALICCDDDTNSCQHTFICISPESLSFIGVYFLCWKEERRKKKKDEKNSKRIELAWTYVFGLHQHEEITNEREYTNNIIWMYDRWISNTRDCVTIMTTTTTTIRAMHCAVCSVHSFFILSLQLHENKVGKQSWAQKTDFLHCTCSYVFLRTFLSWFDLNKKKNISQEIMHLFSIVAFRLWNCHSKRLTWKGRFLFNFWNSFKCMKIV